MIFFLLGVSNGLLFTPPSEVVIWLALEVGGAGTEFHLFTVGNIVGHVFLYHFCKANRERVIGFYVDLERRGGGIRTLFSGFHVSVDWLTDKNGFYIAYGRMLPFFHSFTSVIAAQKSTNYWKFIIYTIIGDYMFSFAFFLHFHLLRSFLSKWQYAIVLLVTVLAIHFVAKKVCNRSS